MSIMFNQIYIYIYIYLYIYIYIYIIALIKCVLMKKSWQYIYIYMCVCVCVCDLNSRFISDFVIEIIDITLPSRALSTVMIVLIILT